MPAFNIPKPLTQLPSGSALPVLPAYTYREPREGKSYIPINVQWDGTTATFNVNVQGITTQQFSQIVMLDVDNSQCGVAVTFFFPDSSDTLTVPAGSGGLYPVFTGALEIYIAAMGSLASDVTRFRVLNYRQEPVSDPPPQATQTGTALNITSGAPTTTALVASTISGTLTSYSVYVGASNGAAATAATITLKDHTSSAVIDQATVLLGANDIYNGIVLQASGLAIRFAGGIDVVTTFTGGGFTSISINAAARFRTP